MGEAGWREHSDINSIETDAQYLLALEYAFDMVDNAENAMQASGVTGDGVLTIVQRVIESKGLDTGGLFKEVPDTETVLTQRAAMETAGRPEESRYEPLPAGTVILGGRYRLIQLLHTSPRLNLYLGRRLPAQPHSTSYTEDRQPLVAIRELVLCDLPNDMRRKIEKAAFEEFVSPAVFGSPRLPGTGDRMRVENERHYLVMQLRPTRGTHQAVAVTLAELLLSLRQWPAWLDTETALIWGVQLCRIVARLHRMGAVLGNLNPMTILVDSNGMAEWAPVLLVFWPPPTQFWSPMTRELRAQLFPLGEALSSDSPFCAFAAPETFEGRRDERSDVYSLGAILYLLLTRYAPVAVPLRQHAEMRRTRHGIEEQRRADDLSHLFTGKSSAYVKGHPPDLVNGIALVPPHLFNDRITPRLEHILQRALDLNPASRFPTVFAMVEALESVDLRSEVAVHANGVGKISRMEKVIEWFRRELHE